MSIRTVKLDKIKLVHSAEKLKLFASSAADVRIADHPEILAWTYSKFAETDIWIARDAISIEIEVTYNGQPLDESLRLRILETLGYGIRDASVWSLLSLSALLEIPSSTDNRLDVLTLNISPSTPLRPSTPPEIQTRAWFSGNMDVRPPPSVTCAKLETIRIQLDFLSIPVKPKRSIKRSRVIPDTADIMLLDDQIHMPLNNHVQTLDEIVNSMKCPSDSMTNSFDQGNSTIASASCSERSVAIPQAAGRRSVKFPKEIRDILVEWVEKHTDNPYPTASEKLELMQRTGLGRSQLSDSLGYHRAKLRRSVTTNIADKFHELNELNDSNTIQFNRTGQPISEIIERSNADYTQLKYQSLLENELPAISDEEEYFDDDMLLFSSQESTTLFARSLTDQASICSMDTVLISTTRSAKRSAEDEILSDKETDFMNSINATLAAQLTKIALRTLVAGDGSSFPGALNGVTPRSPHPETSLARLAPAIFSRGFSKSMAQNSHFLPKISHAISRTMFQNVQSPSLKQKLAQLGASTTEFALHNNVGNSHTTTSDSVASVLQSRLWSMMQRSLYDPSATKTIWKDHCTNTKEDVEEFSDLLISNEDDSGQADVDWMEEDLLDSDFDDILEDEDDDGLPPFFAGDEQEDVISNGDSKEMLFDDLLHGAVSSDDLLLSGGSEDGSMLL